MKMSETRELYNKRALARLARATPDALDSMQMQMERQGETRPFGTYTQRVERTSLNGTQALLFVQRSTTPRGLSLDSIWVDARSWAPLKHVASSPVGSVDATYRNGRITGRTMRGDTTKALDAAIPEGTLDYSTTNAAVRALPLCEGAVVRVSGFDPATGDVREAVYRVVGAERVEIGGAPRDVWTVDVTVNNRTVRMHIDRATGRELDWALPPAANGVTVKSTSQIFGNP